MASDRAAFAIDKADGTDGNGLPVGFHLDSANSAEVKLAHVTLRRTSTRLGWEAISFAEIRDLNLHRTGEMVSSDAAEFLRGVRSASAAI